jgi:hypothetical protein
VHHVAPPSIRTAIVLVSRLCALAAGGSAAAASTTSAATTAAARRMAFRTRMA